MNSPAPVQIELSLQDYFFAEPDEPDDELTVGKSASSDLAGSDHQAPSSNGDRPLAPISLETWEQWFQDWLAYLSPELSPSQSYELSLRLTDDTEIQSLNAQYRHKDQPTDVLAFSALEVDYPQLEEIQAILPLYLGDIVISVETAQKQANQQGHSLQQELAWLAAHALLHLLGWDHPDEASLLRMLEQQEDLLQTIGMTIRYYQADNFLEPSPLDTEATKL